MILPEFDQEWLDGTELDTGRRTPSEPTGPLPLSRRLMARAAVVVALGAAASATSAQVTRDHAALTPDQRSAVERGESVQILEPVDKSPWPRSIVFQFIDASPEECAAVLSDYELQSTYVPRLKSSRIVGRTSANETDVEYVIHIPLFGDEKSVSRQRVVRDSTSYEVQWHTVTTASQPKKSVTNGRATFAPLVNERTGRLGTLMVHDQTVVPSSMFASIPYVRNKGIETSRDAARAIGRQVEGEKTGNADLLARQVARLRAELAARPDTGREFASRGEVQRMVDLKAKKGRP